MERTPGSGRSRELRAYLARRFELSEEAVSALLAVLVGTIHSRLPRSVQVSLVSWIPESWSLLAGEAPTSPASRILGLEALCAPLVEAGLPHESTQSFLAELLGFLERRCGRALAGSIRRRVPELAGVGDVA